MSAKKIAPSQLRSFGLIVGAGFAIIGLFPLVMRSQPPRMWALILSGVLAATALVFPPALRPFHRVWMTIGEALGWVNSRIILSVLYYLVIVPTGVVQRARGHDAMKRRLEPDAITYRILRKKRPPSHMQRQY